jgi:hypothetical protein
MKCPHEAVLEKAISCGKQPAASLDRGNGAGDESARSDFEGSGRQAQVVGSGRDYGSQRPHDAALARRETILAARPEKLRQ